ncbi:MAG: hypothetical protein KDB02_11185 [Acidimicrobiales bacterium]|nr:hypothetical protein [Acidimicrobiales bacterium]
MKVIVAVALTLPLAVSCGSSSDSSSNGKSSSAATTKGSGGDEASDGGTEPTKKPTEVEKFKFEKVADLPKVQINSTVEFKGDIFATVYGDTMEMSIMRIGTDGKTTGPEQHSSDLSLYGVYPTTDALIAVGSNYGTGNMTCGFAKVDPTTLAIGALDNSLQASGNSGCGTPEVFIDGSTLAAVYSSRLAVMDTSTGAVKTIDLQTGQDYASTQITGNKDALFVSYPEDNGSDMATPHKWVLVRLDRKTLAETARATLDGSPAMNGDKLTVQTYNTTKNPDGPTTFTPKDVLEVDQKTLKTKKADSDSPASLCDAVTSQLGMSRFPAGFETGGRIWRDMIVSGTVTGYDPDTCDKSAEATMPDSQQSSDQQNSSGPRVSEQLIHSGDSLLVITASTSTKPDANGNERTVVDSQALYKADVG